MSGQTLALDQARADLAGREFGRWTVLDSMLLTKSGERKWLCRCDCGTERYVLERSLKSGGSLSCGCLRRENIRQSSAHDLAGQRFGALSVLSKAAFQRKNGGIWWTCRCDCGRLYDVPGTLLVTGKHTHCGGPAHGKKYAYVDITGQRFRRLTALYRADTASRKGSALWHCRCDCGTELDVTYNDLVYSHIGSCGCQKKEHDQKLPGFLTHVAGTSLEAIQTAALPANNTTGVRGVYLVHGKYMAKIVFQKKQYFLGSYDRLEDAARVRGEAEKLLFEDTVQFYEAWKARAERDAAWAEEHPVEIRVTRGTDGGLQVAYSPAL